MASAANLEEKCTIIRDTIIYSDLAGVLICKSCLHGINNVKSLRSHWASRHPDTCLSDVHVHDIRKALFEETRWEPLLGSVHQLPLCVGGKMITAGQLQYHKAPEECHDPLLRIPFLPVTFGFQCPQCFKFAYKKDLELSEHLVSMHAMPKESVRVYVSGLDKVPLQSLGKKKREKLFRVYFPTLEELREALLRSNQETVFPFSSALPAQVMNSDSNLCLPLMQNSELYLTQRQNLAPFSAPPPPLPSTGIPPLLSPPQARSPTSGVGAQSEVRARAGRETAAAEAETVHSSSPAASASASSASSSHSSSILSPSSHPLITTSSQLHDGYPNPSPPHSSMPQIASALPQVPTQRTGQIATQVRPQILDLVPASAPIPTLAATAMAPRVMSSAPPSTSALVAATAAVQTPAMYDVPLRSMIENSPNCNPRSIMLERLRFPELLLGCGFTTLGAVPNILCAPPARVARLIQKTKPSFAQVVPGNFQILKALYFVHATKLDICDLEHRISQAVLSYLSRAASVANAAPNFIRASVNAHNGVASTASHSRVSSGIRKPSQNRHVSAGVPHSNGAGQSSNASGCDVPVHDSGLISGSGIPFFRPVTKKETEKAYARDISRLVLALIRLIVCELSIAADSLHSQLQPPNDCPRLSEQDKQTLKLLIAKLLPSSSSPQPECCAKLFLSSLSHCFLDHDSDYNDAVDDDRDYGDDHHTKGYKSNSSSPPPFFSCFCNQTRRGTQEPRPPTSSSLQFPSCSVVLSHLSSLPIATGQLGVPTPPIPSRTSSIDSFPPELIGLHFLLRSLLLDQDSSSNTTEYFFYLAFWPSPQ